MTVEAAGTLSLAVQYASNMLADCATFRTLTATTSRKAALAKCHWRGWPDPSDGHKYSTAELAIYRPSAIVSPDSEGALESQPVGVATWRESGRVIAELIRAVPSGDKTEADRDWDNVVGKICDELQAMHYTQGTEAYLVLESIEIEQGPGRIKIDYAAGEGEEQIAILALEW